MEALVLLSLFFDKKLSIGRKFALAQSTGHGSRFSEVTDITLIIVLSAGARSASNNSVCSISIEALLILLSSNVSDLLSQPALVVTVSSIVGTPLFEIGGLSVGSVSTFALRFVKPGEIDINDDSFIFGFSLFFLFT
jgi:hypothetical protein